MTWARGFMVGLLSVRTLCQVGTIMTPMLWLKKLGLRKRQKLSYRHNASGTPWTEPEPSGISSTLHKASGEMAKEGRAPLTMTHLTPAQAPTGHTVGAQLLGVKTYNLVFPDPGVVPGGDLYLVTPTEQEVTNTGRLVGWKWRDRSTEDVNGSRAVQQERHLHASARP